MAHPDFLTFSHMEACPGLVHGVFSRAGGRSAGPFAGLNLGRDCGDSAEAVRENRGMVLAALGLSRAVFLNQVHGSEVLVLKQGTDIGNLVWDPGTGRTPQPAQADAVVTDVRDLGLVIQVADCQAVILCDPRQQVVANVHSGWRGSVANIVGRCVDTMVREFGCRPEGIFAGISPSLGPCCAEFVNYRDEIPENLWKYKSEDRPCFDFWRMSLDQLGERGLDPEKVRSMEICTRCNPERFYSYRAEKITGRFGAVVGLKRGMTEKRNQWTRPSESA